MTHYENGREYEIYIRDIIKTKYINCWLWEDIPANILDSRFYKNDTICDDIGCDIVGINSDNTIDYIQCKNYSTTGLDNTININVQNAIMCMKVISECGDIKKKNI